MRRKSRLAASARSRKIARLVRQNPFGDYDKDGVPNIYDCEPTNPKKHGVEPSETTWERLRALPIYVSDKSPNVEKFHISDSRAKDFAPKARERFLSLLKNTPEILSDIEKSKPEQIIFTSRYLIPKGGASARQLKEFATIGVTVPTDYDPTTGFVVVSLADKPFAKKPATKWGVEPLKGTTETVFHELEHVKQIQRWGGEGSALYKKMTAGRYMKKPAEVKARKAAEQQMLKSKSRDFPFVRETGEPTFEEDDRDVWSRAAAVMKGEIPAKRGGAA